MSDPVDLTIRVQPTPGDRQVIRIVIPISTGTVDQALALIRGDVPSERNDLGKMSAALDAAVADLNQRASEDALIFALIF